MNGLDLSIDTLVDGFELCFDTGDGRNASLYLAPGRGGGHETVAGLAVERLRAAGLWSATGPKWVTEAQRPAYRAQLRLLAAARWRQDDAELLLARCDHPKFPSDAERWRDWIAALDAVPVHA